MDEKCANIKRKFVTLSIRVTFVISKIHTYYPKFIRLRTPFLQNIFTDEKTRVELHKKFDGILREKFACF